MIVDSPLPLTINHDWSRVRRVYRKLIENYEQGFFDKTVTWTGGYEAHTAGIGSHGSIIISTSLTQGVKWYSWTGTLLEQLLPFAENLKTKFKNNGLKFCNFMYFQHTTNIDKHIDGKQSNELGVLHNQCNVNYVIRADDVNAASYFKDELDTHVYYSTPGQAWLINSGVQHWVNNSGHREIFQIKFHDSYSRVQEYFNKNPLNLTW
jgi:hypothetical protein